MPNAPHHDLSELLDTRALSQLRDTLDESPVIVELRFPGSPHPVERIVFNQYATLADYLRRVARSGDRITVWRYDAVCRPDNVLVRSGASGDGAEADHDSGAEAQENRRAR